MPELLPIPLQLAWPFALAFAWIAGEFGYRWTGLPRISIYGLVGFLFGNTLAGHLPEEETQNLMLLANVAFGLMLFELGYRINLRWLTTNRWIAVTGGVEAIATFGAVYAVAYWFGTTPLSALILASLAMSTSPAGVLRVLNEQNSSGQVTERVLHLSALNCVLAVFAFKVIIGIGVFQTSGSLLHAVWNSLVVLVASAGLGALFGVAVPALLRRLGSLTRDATVAFAITVILLVAITHAFNFSPVLATLTFGLVARHRRVTLSQTQRNFGVMGDLLTVLLFFFVATSLKWDQVMPGLVLGLALIAARFVTKTIGVAAFAHVSGVSWRKGLLTGMALTPLSVFAILMMEQTRHVGVDLVESLMPLTAMVLLLEVIGPIVTQRALIWASETPDIPET
ncbi:MAG TPA: cation:proton antiporter [Noviherbaspirillum sp.]|jgi:Kef-type K+ transport system membrane component KefB|uniref:cation:proton antiporter n=1 Tax=Noviherbaspirillum sp. TaxID=1926288 RepID=UPI002DDD81CC|nr:cation:proton antiporter [Noviherbaspirillum sp.]HEV2610870.1 cation:proton antiporter [Noviherbaspirillum sp.]